MNCDACHNPIPPSKEHTFAGYGFYVNYHGRCCPGEVDGSECGKDHPGKHPANNSGEELITEECHEPGP